jgi:hypothetical protein
MASVKITFNLPEEQEEFYCSINGPKWKKVVSQTLEIVNQLKQNYDSEVFDEILYKIYDKMNEEGLSL